MANSNRGNERCLALSVVIPVYNEEESILSLVAEVQAALGDWDRYELIIVDDGSQDRTVTQLQALQRSCRFLRLLRHRTNCGQSRSLHTGVAAARAEWVATLDGDGQNDPADIPRLWQALRDPASPQPLHLVIGQRTDRHDSWLRILSSRVANGVRSALLGDATPDSGCGLKCFPRRAFLALPFFDHMHRFLPALIQRDGGRVLSVPVHHRPRTRGASKYGVHNRLWVGIVDLLGVLWLLRRARRPEIKEVTADDE